MDQQLHSKTLTHKFSGMHLLVHTKINCLTSAITFLLYTCRFILSTCYPILSHILHKKSHFRQGIANNVYPLHACRAYSKGPGPLRRSPNNYVSIEHMRLCYWLKTCLDQSDKRKVNVQIQRFVAQLLQWLSIGRFFRCIITIAKIIEVWRTLGSPPIRLHR